MKKYVIKDLALDMIIDRTLSRTKDKCMAEFVEYLKYNFLDFKEYHLTPEEILENYGYEVIEIDYK